MSKMNSRNLALLVVAFLMIMLSGLSAALSQSRVPVTQQGIPEIKQITQGDSGWSDWNSVPDVPYQVSQKALSSVFSVSQTAGIEIDNQIYNLKLNSTALERHTESDLSSLREIQGGLGDLMIKAMFATIAICEVYRTESGKIDFKPLHNVKKDGAVLSGNGYPTTMTFNSPLPDRKDLYDPILLIHGIFFFGQQYVPWGFHEDSDSFIVELKNAVFCTREAALYGNDTTIIRSQYTGFRIGNFEFLGEAQLSNTGITLLPGTRFRTKESSGQ